MSAFYLLVPFKFFSVIFIMCVLILQKSIVTFLEEGCARLPRSLAQECKTFIDGNIDSLMGVIIEKLDPDTVCSLFKVCPGKFLCLI